MLALEISFGNKLLLIFTSMCKKGISILPQGHTDILKIRINTFLPTKPQAQFSFLRGVTHTYFTEGPRRPTKRNSSP